MEVKGIDKTFIAVSKMLWEHIKAQNPDISTEDLISKVVEILIGKFNEEKAVYIEDDPSHGSGGKLNNNTEYFVK